MGMFDGLLGGIVGAGMVSVVSDIMEKHGGLQGVVSEFEKNGLGATVQSWVGTGPNQTISQDEVHRVLGPELLRQLSDPLRSFGTARRMTRADPKRPCGRSKKGYGPWQHGQRRSPGNRPNLGAGAALHAEPRRHRRRPAAQVDQITRLVDHCLAAASCRVSIP